MNDSPMDRLSRHLASAMMVQCLAVAGRCGLLSSISSTTPEQASTIAERAGVDPRLATEFLSVLERGGILQISDGCFSYQDGFYSLLGDTTNPMYMGPALRLTASLTEAAPRVASALHSREGVSQGAYPDDLAPAMEAMSQGWVRNLLASNWIPECSGLDARLRSSARVADIGCGGGGALVAVAEAYPEIQGFGLDLSADNIRRAKALAKWSNLESSLSFSQEDAGTALHGRYELIMALNVLHDVAHLDQLMIAVRAHLREDGVFLVVESSIETDPCLKSSAMETILYATSALYCVPATIAHGYASPLGTLGFTEDVLRSNWLVHGPGSVRRLPSEFPFISAYEVRAK